MSSRKTTRVTFDLVPVTIAAIGHQRTTCFPQIAHYTPAFVAAHRRRSLLTPAVRSSSKSQNWITHTQASRPLQLPQLEPSPRVHVEGPSTSPDFSAEIPPAEPVVTNIDIVTGCRMNCRVTTVEGLPRSAGLQFQLTGFSTLINRSAPPHQHARTPSPYPRESITT